MLEIWFPKDFLLIHHLSILFQYRFLDRDLGIVMELLIVVVVQVVVVVGQRVKEVM